MEPISTSCTATDQPWPGSGIQQPPAQRSCWHSACNSRPPPPPPPATPEIIQSLKTLNLRYRVLDSGLVVVGVSLGPHLEVKGPEGSLGEDVVVLHLVPLESLPEIL